jgi:hypothetical protein
MGKGKRRMRSKLTTPPPSPFAGLPAKLREQLLSGADTRPAWVVTLGKCKPYIEHGTRREIEAALARAVGAGNFTLTAAPERV